jgi:hypothetical protein
MAQIPSINTSPSALRRNQMLLRICAFAIAVALERRRTTRESRKGVRRVDARTGAAPSLRQTIVLLGARDAVRWLLGRVIPGSGEAPELVKREMEHELKRARVEHSDDPSARQEATMRVLQKRQGVQVGCLPVLLRAGAAVVVDRCRIPFLSERRTLVDLLAGTKLVDDRPSRRTRLRWRYAH